MWWRIFNYFPHEVQIQYITPNCQGKTLCLLLELPNHFHFAFKRIKRRKAFCREIYKKEAGIRTRKGFETFAGSSSAGTFGRIFFINGLRPRPIIKWFDRKGSLFPRITFKKRKLRMKVILNEAYSNYIH